MPESALLFVYGSLTHPEDLARLGQPVRRVTLRGFRRGWTVCTDNTDPDRRVTYYRPGTTIPEPIQVLFLAIEPDPAAATEGLVIRVDADSLPELDRREGNYVRQHVDGAFWTYAATAEARARARAGLARGTARIRREYLDRVHAGLATHGLLAAFEREVGPPPVPVVPLTRVLTAGPGCGQGPAANGTGR
jgi:hypothetical protein